MLIFWTKLKHLERNNILKATLHFLGNEIRVSNYSTSAQHLTLLCKATYRWATLKINSFLCLWQTTVVVANRQILVADRASLYASSNLENQCENVHATCVSWSQTEKHETPHESTTSVRYTRNISVHSFSYNVYLLFLSATSFDLVLADNKNTLRLRTAGFSPSPKCSP